MGQLDEIINSEKYKVLTPGAKKIVLSRLMPEFSGLSPSAQEIVIQKLDASTAAPSAPLDQAPQTQPIDDGLMAAHGPPQGVDAPNQMVAAHEPTLQQPSVMQRTARILSPYARPVLESGGALAGGVLGAGGGLPTGPGAIATGAAGAGIGLGIGKSAADIIDNYAGARQPKSVGQEIVDSAKTVAAGAAGAAPTLMAGPVAGFARNAAVAGVGGVMAGGTERALEGEGGSIKDELKRAAVDYGTAAAADVAGNAITGGASRVAGAIGSKPGKLSQHVQEAEAAGINVPTSSVFEPKSFAGRWARATGDKVPIAGTGGMWVKNQKNRVKAIEKTLKDFGVEDEVELFEDGNASLLDVAKDLSKKHSDDVIKYNRWKDEIINSADSAGPVDVARTIDAVDSEIDRLAGINEKGYAPVINKLKEFKSGIDGKPLSIIEGNRELLGNSFKPQEYAGVRKQADKSISKIYGALNEDMGQHIENVSGPDARKQWKTANKKLHDMIGELKVGSIKSAINKGVATPEELRKVLFSKRRSDIELLGRKLTPKGKDHARQAILSEARARSLDSDGNISPAKFVSNVKKLGDSIGVMFSGNGLRQVEGLQRALNMTKHADIAGITPPTGVQNLPVVGGAVLVNFLGGAGGLAAAGGVGAAARLYESKPVRDALIKLSRTEHGTAAEEMALERVYSQIAAVAAAQGLIGGNDDDKDIGPAR